MPEKSYYCQLGLIFLTVLLTGAVTIVEAQPKNADCGPRIRLGSLLDNLRIAPDGRVSIGRLYADCLPDPARQSQSGYAYHPYDGGRLAAEIRDASGANYATFVFYGRKVSTLWELDRYETVGGPAGVKPLAAGGRYELRFLIENREFMKFPFRVGVAESPDVYRPQKFFLLDGPWRDYAEIGYPNPNRYTQLRVWLRGVPASDPNGTPVSCKFRIVREADSKTLAEGAESYRLAPEWQLATLSFAPAGAKYGEFPAAALLERDGRYRIELAIDDKPYGVYRFEVRDRQFYVSDRTPPADFGVPLESGPKGFALWRSDK
ncbi:MAG: hypothetical protein JSS81_24860 [Acidobacteria bacterium]|nr:hypothetical protein [Acidobacteriota bacterium]